MAASSDADSAAFWTDFNQRMSPTEADRALGVAKNTVMAAIRRGEIKPLRLPNKKRVFVTPNILAEWVADYWH